MAMQKMPVNGEFLFLDAEGSKQSSGHKGSVIFREARKAGAAVEAGRLIGGSDAPEAVIYVRFEGGPWVALRPGEALRHISVFEPYEIWWPAQAGFIAQILEVDAERFEAIFRVKGL